MSFRLLDYCISTTLDKSAQRNEINAYGCNQYRSILKDRFVRMASEMCLANVMFVNDEALEKILKPLLWANQNEGYKISQVYIFYNIL